VVQSGEQEVVHEQVTFPGDAWAVCSKEDGALLVLHVATGEREQRVHICPEARAAAETAQAVAPAVEIPASTVDDGDDPELAAAIAASLAAPVAKPSCSSDRLSEALSLSQRLCTAWRAMARLQQASAGTSAAGAAGGGGGPSVRLQIVLPGGERSFHEVDGSATLAGVGSFRLHPTDIPPSPPPTTHAIQATRLHLPVGWAGDSSCRPAPRRETRSRMACRPRRRPPTGAPPLYRYPPEKSISPHTPYSLLYAHETSAASDAQSLHTHTYTPPPSRLRPHASFTPPPRSGHPQHV